MKLRYIGPFDVVLPDAPEVGEVAPGTVIDVNDQLAASLLEQTVNWIEDAPPPAKEPRTRADSKPEKEVPA